ncbi:MAG TPA: cytochrome c oxidase subunit II transmembrane domain-containing protein [Flavobacteriales bacterium]|nr:cytochrome c oxidase subunit II transmembrane domain-containing protein [Flavobacteriales bacterium]
MEKLLIVLVLMVGVIAIAQMMRVYEISAKMRGKKEEEISYGDNVFNANMMLIFMFAFYGLFFWLLAKYGNGGIGPSASEHGESLDWLLNFNFLIIIIVFFICNTLLFWFAFKYYHKGPGTKAYWFTHDNKLELVWTAVPAVVLAVIIILGLRAWNEITGESGKKAIRLELYSKQFDWTVRYSGEDNQLGRADFRMINGSNPLGVLTKQGMVVRQNELRSEIVGLAVAYYKHTNDKGFLERLNRKILNGYSDTLDAKIKWVDETAGKDVLSAWEILSAKKEAETFEKMERLQRHLLKIMAVEKTITDKEDQVAMDDIIEKEIHLIKGQEYEFQFRSQDVIHSAFFPHFRAQMNTVPGMITRLKFIPTISTAEMKVKMKNEKFGFVLLCNKICGAAHQNMQLPIYVWDLKDPKEKATYEAWMKKVQAEKAIRNALGVAPPAEEAPASVNADTTATNAGDTTKVNP